MAMPSAWLLMQEGVFVLFAFRAFGAFCCQRFEALLIFVSNMVKNSPKCALSGGLFRNKICWNYEKRMFPPENNSIGDRK
jgi:hypothetical protein